MARKTQDDMEELMENHCCEGKLMTLSTFKEGVPGDQV